MTTIKYLILTPVILLFVLSTKGQSDNLDLKEIQKTFAKINDTLYASKFEVTNIQYVSFLKSLKKSNQNEKYLTAQIDSARWSQKLSYCDPYTKYYHNHPAYLNYPIVNISFEGATLFCEWLTELYNSNSKRKFQKVQFRLPTDEEWTTAAKAGNPNAIYPWDGTALQNKKDQRRCNFKSSTKPAITGYAGKINDNADVTAPVRAYWPNNFGIYNLSGNVAEMLAVKGSTKGGSWQDAEEAMKIDVDGKYSSFDGPMATIGFRYFVDVIED